LIARRLQPITKPLSAAFYALAICMAGVTATSYSLSSAVYATHWAFAIALTICILVTILWLIKQRGLVWLDWILIGVVVITVILSASPIVHDIPVVKIYIPRELLVFTCSLWLLGRAALRMTARA
jgi:hypothetical protein